MSITDGNNWGNSPEAQEWGTVSQKKGRVNDLEQKYLAWRKKEDKLHLRIFFRAANIIFNKNISGEGSKLRMENNRDLFGWICACACFLAVFVVCFWLRI